MFYIISAVAIVVALIFGIITSLKVDKTCNDE